METRTPIALITGCLGSGKTTLLRHLLDTTSHRLAILMNEFGEIAIDSQVLRGHNVQIIELTGGCVCCSLTGELEAAVGEIIERVHPDLIVVEATGVAEADALVYEVQDNLPQVRLDTVICIVDAYTSIKYPQVGYTSRTQLAAADIVVINKVDLVTREELEQVEAQVQRYNDRAMIIRAERCSVDSEVLLGASGERPAVSMVAPVGETSWESFVYTTDRLIDEPCLQQVIAQLPAAVYRAKGWVRLVEGSRLFNYVSGRADWEVLPAEQTQLVFIGLQIHELRATILDQLRRCEV
jgi:G3E family GTPase